MLAMPSFLWIISLCSVVMATGTGLKGGLITCECTTTQCVQMQMRVCTTDSLCFVQHLETESGRPSLVRGCIGGRTPLLCENRRPSRARNWPLLLCCGTDFCNRGAVPSPPPWHVELAKSAASYLKPDPHGGDSNNNATLDLPQVDAEPSTDSEESSTQLQPFTVQKSPWPHIVSPVYVSVLVLGVVCLIIIGIIAASVIRKNNRFYAEQYGALEYQRGKTTSTLCDCDDEAEPVGSSQPYLHIVCPNRNT